MKEVKFKNKFQIKSSRLAGYDYSRNGMYFVTICTKGREHFFGEIRNGKMILSEVGEIVRQELLRTPDIRPNINLDTWIIMPNHLHVILEILNVETPRRGVSKKLNIPAFKHREMFQWETPQRGVSTGGHNVYWKSGSLGSIVNQFKSACTKRIWKLQSITFAWQPRFYDHIIRNNESLNKIREYIMTNPETWERDRNNPENIYM